MNRVAIVVAAGAIAVGALSGCGQAKEAAGTGSGAPPAGAAAAAPAVRTISLKVNGGKVSGDTGRIAVPLGTPVVVSVSSDVADEIHVHGYDRTAKVPAGATGTVAFTANNAGVFEIELEKSKRQLLLLQVG